MQKLTIHYGVQNGGDGSANVNFYESGELAEWDDENQDEGYGESTTGSIEVTSDSVMSCDTNVQSAAGYLFNKYLDDYNSTYGYGPKSKNDYAKKEFREFCAKFYPEGVPINWYAREIRETGNNDYWYVDLMIGDTLIEAKFTPKDRAPTLVKDLIALCIEINGEFL
jgi:hypothetical protein